MSLAVLADHMATKGRGPDSRLVHMSPRELQALQALAAQHGKTLTINPETGLPEAGVLDALLPMAAGFMLGPAGFALMGEGMAALTVGGITTLATGSLQKGLMAGMGAYGGAGLGGALAAAGTADTAAQLAGTSALENQSAAEAARLAAHETAARGTFGNMASGFDAVTSSPKTAMDFAKNNWKPMAAAALPILSSIQTTTPLGSSATPGYIRPHKYDPLTQTYTAGTPVLDSEWGSRGFADGGAIEYLAGGGPTREPAPTPAPDVAPAPAPSVEDYKAKLAQRNANAYRGGLTLPLGPTMTQGGGTLSKQEQYQMDKGTKQRGWLAKMDKNLPLFSNGAPPRECSTSSTKGRGENTAAAAPDAVKGQDISNSSNATSSCDSIIII